MPMSATCRNCGGTKTPDTYWDDYCTDCQKAINISREEAIKAGTDLGAAKRSALAERAHTVHNNRPDPRRPLTRGDYWTAADPNPTGSESEK